MELDNFTVNFYKKIHHLQGYLADWNTNVFGQVAQNKKKNACVLGQRLESLICINS